MRAREGVGRMEVREDLIALPAERAAELADVSDRRLRYWERTGLIVPEIRHSFGPRSNVRLYSFQDLVSLLVASALLKRSFKIQQIRRVVTHLRSRGYREPLSELRFATTGNADTPGQIYFQHPDGTWEGNLRPDQIVLEEVIRLDPVRARIRAAARRPRMTPGQIERHRGRLGSKPVFAGTRIPVEVVLRRWAHGFSDQEILEAYPDLTKKDLEAARSYAVSA